MPTILLVDDDASVRQVIEAYLLDAGFDVVSAANTIVGAQQLATNPNVDLCLVDIVMPHGMPDGSVFAQSVRSKIPSMPVILMTGYSGPVGSIGDALSSLIYKPIKWDALLAEIKRLLVV